MGAPRGLDPRWQFRFSESYLPLIGVRHRVANELPDELDGWKLNGEDAALAAT
jgi:hypothetical protein